MVVTHFQSLVTSSSSSNPDSTVDSGNRIYTYSFRAKFIKHTPIYRSTKLVTSSNKLVTSSSSSKRDSTESLTDTNDVNSNGVGIFSHSFGAKHTRKLRYSSKLVTSSSALAGTKGDEGDYDDVNGNGVGNFGAKYTRKLRFSSKLVTSCSKRDLNDSLSDVEGDGKVEGVEVEIEKVSRNRRRIRSKVVIDASLETVWGILTDYERLAEYIPGLVVSQVLEQKTNFARLLQIGQQNLAFGLKFNAKGVVDCYEKDFEVLPYGQRRDIDFKMIEGDFDLFEGKWSIEQLTDGTDEESQRYNTTLSYTVEVEPKIWLPVRLVEGRLSKEIQMNLFSIREVAQRTLDTISSG